MVTASGGTMTPEAIARCGKKEQIIGSCSGCPTEDQLPAFCAQKQVKFALGRTTPDEKSLIEECCPVVPLTCPDPAEEDCIPEGVPTFITTRSAIINDLGYQLPTVAAVKPASDVSLASDTSSIVGAAIFGAQVANILGSGSTYIGGQQGTHPIFIQTKWGVTVSSGVFNTPVFVGKQPPSTQTIPPLTSLPTSTPTTEVFTFVPAGCLGKRTCEVKNGQVVWSGCELPEGVSIQSCYPAPPKCGDGNVDEGEVCGEPGLTCTGSDVCINCACSPPPPTCGDGTVAPGEMCGEPGLPGCPIGTQCNSCVCSPNPLCGNGLVDPGEMCGESPFTPSCPPSFNCINCGCVPIPPGCGDGVLTSPETCEPGVVACSVGQVCNNCVCGLPPVFCGNGVLETGEACDDGNRNLCDGCSSSCTKEICGDRVVCPTQNEVCEPPSVGTCGSNCQPIASCGDGAITSPETCEPPNTATCGPTCVSIGCGNGVVDSGESCDDGNTASGDGCSSTCLIEKCGNNFVDSGEECDSPSSYCTTATINPGWCDQSVCKCKPAPPPLCGNGRVEALANEQCDPPSTGSCTTGNYCDTSCQCSPLPVCGNGKQEPGEMCDPAGSSCTDPLGRASTCNSACVCPAPTRPTTIIPGIPPIIFGCPGCTTITSTPTNPVATPTNSVPGNPIIRTPTTTLNPTTEPVKDTCAYGETDIKLERIESVDPSLLPKGAQFAFGLRALNSGKGVYDITAAISEAFGSDTEVVKCSKEDSGYLCSTYLGATTSFSSGCAGMSYNRLTYEQMGARKPTVEYAELPTFSEDFTTIAQEGKVFQQGKYVVELKENALLSIGPPSDILDQPQNPYSMIFTSLEVGIPEGVDSLTARVTLPLPRPIPSGIDKYSVRLFVWNRDHWLYIDAVPDLALGLVSAEIDLRAFAVNGKVLFAVIVTVCYACDQSKFDLVYDGGGEKAVVLVHGLTSNGIGTWAPMIKDIEAAKLPLQVYLFSYPTWWPMERVSEDLVVNLDSLSDKYKIFPVGHSVGGLIVQHALFTSYVRRLEDPSLFRYLDKVENGAVIVLGAPNKGSPVEDVWKSLYGYILKLKAPNAPFNLNAPLLHDAVNGRQIPPVPGIKYFIVAGTKPFEFNLGFFSITTEELLRLFTPNDGMIQVDSAYTLGSEEFNDLCDNYFEVHLDHIELNDHELARRIIERIITQQFRDAAPITQPMPGYSKYVNFKGQDWMTDDLFLIVGKTLPETERPSALTGCACGNGACGEDESPFICPTDCFISKVRTFCVAAPVWIYLLLALSVLVFIVHAVRGKKEHGRSHIILYILLGIALLLNLLMLLTCRSLSLLALFATLGIIIFVFLESRLRRHRGEHEPEGRQVIPEKTVPAPKTMPRPLFVPSKKPPKPLFVPTKPQSEKKPPKPEDSYDKTVKEAKRVLKRFKV